MNEASSRDTGVISASSGTSPHTTAAPAKIPAETQNATT
jgi:hypothetical protein